MRTQGSTTSQREQATAKFERSERSERERMPRSRGVAQAKTGEHIPARPPPFAKASGGRPKIKRPLRSFYFFGFNAL